MDELTETDTARGTDEVLAIHRKLRELDKRLDRHIEMATERLDILKTSVDLDAHIMVIMGWTDLMDAPPEHDPEAFKSWQDRRDIVTSVVKRVRSLPEVREVQERISALRTEVALKMGLQAEMEEVTTLTARIRSLLASRGVRTGKENYIQTLSQGLALFGMAFYGKDIIYRTTDFKSNEYRNLMGGLLFETVESNPMIGFRGVSRNIHDWELEAFKLARGAYGATNLHVMFPFVRTLEEARSMKKYLKNVHGLESGEEGLKVILMSEIPSNAILCKEFIKEVDGFSIGSNDMTQMVLATDRDNPVLQHIYDEEDPAVVWAILVSIFAGQKYGKKVGFCGQGVSNSLILRGLVAIAGITSASVVPDTYQQTKFDVAEVESENIPLRDLGDWLKKQHFTRLKELLEANSFGHVSKHYATPEDLEEWYEAELKRLHDQLKEHLGSPKEDFYRQEVCDFRRLFHKPVIYSGWDWNATVEDALRQAGFSSFEEQEAAHAEQLKALGID